MSMMNEFTVFNNQQYLLPCDIEPVCVDADEEIFWVAYGDGTIHGYSTNQSNTNRKFENLIEFKTIWQNITQIASLPKLNRFRFSLDFVKFFSILFTKKTTVIKNKIPNALMPQNPDDRKQEWQESLQNI